MSALVAIQDRLGSSVASAYVLMMALSHVEDREQREALEMAAGLCLDHLDDARAYVQGLLDAGHGADRPHGLASLEAEAQEAKEAAERVSALILRFAPRDRAVRP